MDKKDIIIKAREEMRQEILEILKDGINNKNVGEILSEIRAIKTMDVFTVSESKYGSYRQYISIDISDDTKEGALERYSLLSNSELDKHSTFTRDVYCSKGPTVKWVY